MSRVKSNHDAVFKARVVREAIKEEKTKDPAWKQMRRGSIRDELYKQIG